jgi:hypothetical protein
MSPAQYRLNQNYPNPFNPSTEISYALKNSTHVNLAVYNCLGQKVATLVDQKQSRGKHSMVFQPQGLSSGIYFLRLATEEGAWLKRMVYLK